MFRKFFQRFEPREIVDPVFGVLANDRHGNWNGRFGFEPLKKEIDISIRCLPEQTPSEVHRDFLALLVAEWPKVHEEMRGKLFADLPDWTDGTTMERLFESLEFECFSFWDFSSRPRMWEIAATTPLFEWGVFNITMLDLAFKCYGMDD